MAPKKEEVKAPDRVLIAGKPDLERCDNKVVSARYTLVSFLPVVCIMTFAATYIVMVDALFQRLAEMVALLRW